MFTMLVLMAIVTTAATAPLIWLIWLRHHKKQGGNESGENLVVSENYLTATLDKDFLKATENDVGYDPEDLVGNDALAVVTTGDGSQVQVFTSLPIANISHLRLSVTEI